MLLVGFIVFSFFVVCLGFMNCGVFNVLFICVVGVDLDELGSKVCLLGELKWLLWLIGFVNF